MGKKKARKKEKKEKKKEIKNLDSHCFKKQNKQTS